VTARSSSPAGSKTSSSKAVAIFIHEVEELAGAPKGFARLCGGVRLKDEAAHRKIGRRGRIARKRPVALRRDRRCGHSGNFQAGLAARTASRLIPPGSNSQDFQRQVAARRNPPAYLAGTFKPPKRPQPGCRSPARRFCTLPTCFSSGLANCCVRLEFFTAFYFYALFIAGHSFLIGSSSSAINALRGYTRLGMKINFFFREVACNAPQRVDR